MHTTCHITRFVHTTCHITRFGAQDPRQPPHTPCFMHKTYDDLSHHAFRAQNPLRPPFHAHIPPQPAMLPISVHRTLHQPPTPPVSRTEPTMTHHVTGSMHRTRCNPPHHPFRAARTKHHHAGIRASAAPAFRFQNPLHFPSPAVSKTAPVPAVMHETLNTAPRNTTMWAFRCLQPLRFVFGTPSPLPIPRHFENHTSTGSYTQNTEHRTQNTTTWAFRLLQPPRFIFGTPVHFPSPAISKTAPAPMQLAVMHEMPNTCSQHITTRAFGLLLPPRFVCLSH